MFNTNDSKEILDAINKDIKEGSINLTIMGNAFDKLEAVKECVHLKNAVENIAAAGAKVNEFTRFIQGIKCIDANDAVNQIVNKLNHMLAQKEFDDCNILVTVAIDEIPIYCYGIFLLCTYPVKDKIPAREKLFAEAKRHKCSGIDWLE